MANAKKPRTKAQKDATAALVAFNKKRHAAAGKTTAAAPAKAKAKRSYSKAKPTKKIYKKNPISQNASVKRGKGMFEENIKPAALGAAAALGFDIVWGRMTFIPANLRAGNLKYPVKLLAALGLGVAAEKFLPQKHKHHAVTLVRGPLTVIMHDAAKDFMQTTYPNIALAAYEEDQMAEIIHEMNGVDDDIGFYDQIQAHQPQAIENMGERMDLNEFAVPQYDNVAY